jgi:phosphate-selective porin OprO and OprP
LSSSFRRRTRRVVLIALISLVAARAGAQAPAPQPTTGFQDGFFIQSADGDHRLAFGLVAQVDARFELGDTVPVGSTFGIRKARPTLTGRVGRYFDFKVMPDFGSGQAVLTDAYFDIRFWRALRVRTGKDKTPIGHELLQGDGNLMFQERTLASSLVPNRDVGIQAQGEAWGPRLSYAAGVFNGIPDGTSSTADTDANGAKDLAGRVTVQPFRPAAGPAGPLAGFGLFLGGSHGTQAGALPSFRTTYGQVYFSYAAGVAAAGTRARVTPAAFYYRGPFGVFTEYIRSAQRVTRGTEAFDIANHAWEVTGSYVLTGEPASDRGIRPRQNFDPAAGHWGAVQVTGRYSALTVDDEVFDHGLGAAGASRRARSWAAGVNWYPNPWVKWYATVERTFFDEGVTPARADENILFLRAQVAF